MKRILTIAFTAFLIASSISFARDQVDRVIAHAASLTAVASNAHSSDDNTFIPPIVGFSASSPPIDCLTAGTAHVLFVPDSWPI